MEENAPQIGVGYNERQVPELQAGIVFDSSCGISLQEQQEIFAGIDAMTGGSRLVSEMPLASAKKRGFLFPLLVNIAAVVLLAAGFVLLSRFYVQEEQGIRESSSVLGLTERALIQEIRQETGYQLSHMENEINSILIMLSAADSEYRLLQDSIDVLTEVQQERAASLLLIQEGYRNTLSGLQDERARIIEDSRAREAALRAQAEERFAALSAHMAQREADLSAAMEELHLLSTDQQRAARAESQMNAYYASTSASISAGLLDEAGATLQTMREFLDAPSLQSIRAAQERRQGHVAAITALEGALSEARRLAHAVSELEGGQPVAALAEMHERYAALELRLEEQGHMMAGIDAAGAESIQRITEQQNTISTLRTENERLSASTASQQQALTQRQSEVQALSSQLQAASARAQQSEAALETQRAQNAALSERTEDLQSRYDDLQRRLEAAMGLFQ